MIDHLQVILVIAEQKAFVAGELLVLLHRANRLAPHEWGRIGRCARAVRIFGPAGVMALADLSSPRGRTQYPYALLEPWPRSGPHP